MSELADFSLRPGVHRGDSAYSLNLGRHRFAFDPFPGKYLVVLVLGSASHSEREAALQAMDTAINGASPGLEAPLVHLLVLALAFGVIARVGLRRFVA